MEARVKEMEQQLAIPERAADMKLIAEYAETMKQLDAENERWLSLSEELEQAAEALRFAK